MEQMTTHVGIEPGRGLVGRFGDTVILIPRSEAPDDDSADPDEAAGELLGLAAVVASDRQVPPSTIAARLAAWVIGRLAGDPLAFGIVVPARDGVVMFLRGAVWCTVTEGGSTRELSGEQALTWVDQIVPGTFEWLAIGAAAGQPVRADPLSDLRDGVVPGQGFVLTRAESALDPESAEARSGYDLESADAESGYDLESASAEAGSRYDPEPASAEAGSRYGPDPASAEAGSRYDPEPASAEAGSRYDPEPASAEAGSRYDPEPASAEPGSRYDPEPASAEAGSRYDPEPASAEAGS